MFERFTEDARLAVVHAGDEARALRHHHIGCEHLLLALFKDPSTIAARALQTAGADAEAVRARLLEHVPPGSEEVVGQLPFTPRAKKTLELALREAMDLRHNFIGSEHLLLGLLREEDTMSVRVLSELGAAPGSIRAAVLAAVPASDPDDMNLRRRLRGARRPVARVEPSPLEGGILIEPCHDVRRLLMSAAARALDDGRTRIDIRDVEEALRRWHESGDPPAAAAG